jgi:hypothetical protein
MPRHVIALVVDQEEAARLHRAHEVMPSEIPDPGVGIDQQGHGWPRRQVREGDAGRPVATTACLVGALVVIVLLEGGGDRAHLLGVAGPLDPQALLREGPVIPFNEGIQIRAAGRIDLHRDAQAAQEVHHRRGDVLLVRMAHETGIAIEGDPLGQALLALGLGHAG